jgi:purine-binding chemotaxis protein CheW
MRRQLVVFKIGPGEFAVDILTVREVVLPREITPVPEMPDYVEGVINLRGNLIPVLDLRKRMRSRQRHHADETAIRIIIAMVEEKLVGLIVDQVSDAVRIEEDHIKKAPEMITEIGALYVSGVIHLGHRFVTMIDLKKALSEQILCELDDVVNALARVTGDSFALAEVV